MSNDQAFDIRELAYERKREAGIVLTLSAMVCSGIICILVICLL